MLTTTQQVDSRIIIDTYAYNRFNPNRIVALSSLATADQCSDSYSKDDYISDDEQPGAAQESHAALTKDELLIASPSVKGYALKTKKWRESAFVHFTSPNILLTVPQ